MVPNLVLRAVTIPALPDIPPKGTDGCVFMVSDPVVTLICYTKIYTKNPFCNYSEHYFTHKTAPCATLFFVGFSLVFIGLYGRCSIGSDVRYLGRCAMFPSTAGNKKPDEQFLYSPGFYHHCSFLFLSGGKNMPAKPSMTKYAITNITSILHILPKESANL